jgi:hypothetical protein
MAAHRMAAHRMAAHRMAAHRMVHHRHRRLALPSNVVCVMTSQAQRCVLARFFSF